MYKHFITPITRCDKDFSFSIAARDVFVVIQYVWTSHLFTNSRILHFSWRLPSTRCDESQMRFTLNVFQKKTKKNCYFSFRALRSYGEARQIKNSRVFLVAAAILDFIYLLQETFRISNSLSRIFFHKNKPTRCNTFVSNPLTAARVNV